MKRTKKGTIVTSITLNESIYAKVDAVQVAENRSFSNTIETLVIEALKLRNDKALEK